MINLFSSDLINHFFLCLLFQIREQCQELILTDKHIEELMKRVIVEIERGLGNKTHNEADIKCFVTYVQELPNGKGKRNERPG